MSSSQLVPVTIVCIADQANDLLAQAVASVAPAAEAVIISYQPHAQWPAWCRQHNFRGTVIELDQPLTDFAQARNQAMQYAHQPWVFFLDSDEVLEAESWPVIHEVVTKNTLAGVYVNRHDYYFGKRLRWGEVANVWLLRLAQKEKIQFHRPVHEWADVKGATARLPIEIRHYSHQSVADFLQTVAGYARREAVFRHQHRYLFFWPELIIYPVAKWVQNVFLRFAFLDGWRGMTYALMMSIHSLLVRIYLYELETNRR